MACGADGTALHIGPPPLEELVLLYAANRNPAFQPFQELFEDKPLAEKTVYKQVTQQLPEYFATRPLIPLPGAKPLSLLELLRAPAEGSPGSLSDQLALIRRLWKPLIGDSLERLLEIASEILHEEDGGDLDAIQPSGRDRGQARARGHGGGEDRWRRREVPTFGDPAYEYEKFSQDMAWMPQAVLMAKSTYVWLAQLSRAVWTAYRAAR